MNDPGKVDSNSNEYPHHSMTAGNIMSLEKSIG
jgi:hypothetical protein